jgi:hypothetical protein
MLGCGRLKPSLCEAMTIKPKGTWGILMKKLEGVTVYRMLKNPEDLP